MWVEHELRITAAEVLPDDHLFCGHHWWGRVRRANRFSALGLTSLEVGGMEFNLLLIPEQQVSVRRQVQIDGSSSATSTERAGS